MNLAVVLNTHENSPVFKDTLESVRHHWTDNVLVVVDGKNWDQFRDEEIPAVKLEGFVHGKESAPYRNVCLGLMKAWDFWGEEAEWYSYMEYDCLVGSAETKNHLKMAGDMGYWILGNDHRQENRKMPFLERLEGCELNIHYLLGCCLFFSRDFMRTLAERDFFERFLKFTNFNDNVSLVDEKARNHAVYDLSEFLYPTLAVSYGGKIGELACWIWDGWRGKYDHYPMRFRPDLVESPFEQACVMHPMKEFENPVRTHHRHKRSGLLTGK
jgi:hypothetical protein